MGRKLREQVTWFSLLTCHAAVAHRSHQTFYSQMLFGRRGQGTCARVSLSCILSLMLMSQLVTAQPLR